MNKHNIILAILFLVLGFGTGYFYFKNFSNVNAVVENQEVKNDTVAVGQNKLFEFFDSFKNTPGNEKVTEIREDLGLMIFTYPKGEVVIDGDGGLYTYGIYDYKNDILYKDLGYSQLSGVSRPVSLISKDKVLVETADNERFNTTLSIHDFNNKKIKDLPIKIQNVKNVEIGHLYNGSISIFVHEKLTSMYQLDAKTLEVKKLWER